MRFQVTCAFILFWCICRVLGSSSGNVLCLPYSYNRPDTMLHLSLSISIIFVCECQLSQRRWCRNWAEQWWLPGGEVERCNTYGVSYFGHYGIVWNRTNLWFLFLVDFGTWTHNGIKFQPSSISTFLKVDFKFKNKQITSCKPNLHLCWCDWQDAPNS